MISAESAIHRFNRDLTLSLLLKVALIAAGAAAVIVGPMIGMLDWRLMLLAVGFVWIVLSLRSVRGSRIAADSPSLIAAGQFDTAERHIIEALHAFSLFRTVKLLSLHHLALLRHAQRRWTETAMLCRALLRQRLGAASGLGRSAHLILADSLLEMNDLKGAHESLMRLYDQRLSLAEALKLLSVQMDYLSRIGAWDAMLAELPTRVLLAELMPTPAAAQTQALLALAARHKGRPDWEAYLRRRAELLVDPPRLVERRPILRPLWEPSA